MTRLFALTLALGTLVGLHGCAPAGLMMQDTTYEFSAQYRGLENQSVAVLVSADEHILFRYPHVPYQTSRAVGQRLQANVQGINLVNPADVRAYQDEYPYWVTQPYSEIGRQFGVTRLVIIDLTAYTTNNPGDAHVWRGGATSTVGVVEIDGPTPDDFAFYADVSAQFPEGEMVGVIEEDSKTMQIGLLNVFGRNASRLFHDYDVVK